MAQLAVGLVILLAWGVATFSLHPDSGWIHVGLVLGVLLVIRGLVLWDDVREA